MGDKYIPHHKRKKPKLTKEQIKERRKNKRMKSKIIKSKSGGN